MSRLNDRFAALQADGRAAFVPFIMGGDPDPATSLALLKALPAAGADVIEIGVPFTDPMADGPAIQAAGLRALKAGQTLAGVLDMVRAFRAEDQATPIVLMGYYNPFYIYGTEAFLADAVAAGVDGLIIVDLPPEEDAEFCLPARAAGLDFIRLATPTTDAARLPAVIKNTSGFVYYVSVAGITGAGAGAQGDIAAAVQRLRQATALPVAVGFGVKTEEKAIEIAKSADAVVVGSALVDALAKGLEQGPDAGLQKTLELATQLSGAVRRAREEGSVTS